MPVTGLAITHQLDGLVTDSAASATALATGSKTENGRIGMLPDGTKLRTVFELARSIGKSTGLVTTDSITGATPAGFVAHVPSRGQEEDIAAQMLSSRTEVLFGGGRRQFLPADGGGNRADGRNLVDEAKKRGYATAMDVAQFDAAQGPRLLGLFADGSMSDPAGPSLTQMTMKAIAALGRNKHGYILMSEQAFTDKYGHANNAAGVVNALWELDRAIRAAMELAAKNKDTLILVTADHDCGGMAIKGEADGELKFEPGWVSGGHTGIMVSIYAFGPGAELFTGTHDNTDIPKLIARLWGKGL